MMDPLVRDKVRYRRADEFNFDPLIGQATVSFSQDALFLNKYEAYKKRQRLLSQNSDSSQLKKKLSVMEKAIKSVPAALQKYEELKAINLYPKNIPFDKFDWKDYSLSCPVCFHLKMNDTFGVFPCYHVICDSCNR